MTLQKTSTQGQNGVLVRWRPRGARDRASMSWRLLSRALSNGSTAAGRSGPVLGRGALPAGDRPAPRDRDRPPGGGGACPICPRRVRELPPRRELAGQSPAQVRLGLRRTARPGRRGQAAPAYGGQRPAERQHADANPVAVPGLPERPHRRAEAAKFRAQLPPGPLDQRGRLSAAAD